MQRLCLVVKPQFSWHILPVATLWHMLYAILNYLSRIDYILVKNCIKTRPDSLTNQRLPGINATKIVLFLVITK